MFIEQSAVGVACCFVTAKVSEDVDSSWKYEDKMLVNNFALFDGLNVKRIIKVAYGILHGLFVLRKLAKSLR